MDYITELFCVLDDFCKEFKQSLDKSLISDKKSKPQKSALSLSEAMTIVIYHGHALGEVYLVNRVFGI